MLGQAGSPNATSSNSLIANNRGGGGAVGSGGAGDHRSTTPPLVTTGNSAVTSTSTASKIKGGGGGVDAASIDPVLLAVWGCGGIPCQASIHDRIAGKIHRQPIGGDDGGGGGSDPSSSASSCFVAVPRQGFLFAATKSIAEHFYPSGNGVIADSSPATRLWYSIEVPQTITFEALPTPLGGDQQHRQHRNGEAGGGGNKKRSTTPGRLSIRLPSGQTPLRNGQQMVHTIGGGGGGGAGGGPQTLKVSATTPFGVVLDQLRVLLEDSIMTSPVFATLPVRYRTNGIRAFVDLPVRIILNIDDAPPADLLTIGALTYDRDAAMMLRQTQKEATATMFAGSVAPLLMIEPSTLDNLRYSGSSKSLDPVPFLQVKREIINRGLAVLAKACPSSSSAPRVGSSGVVVGGGDDDEIEYDAKRQGSGNCADDRGGSISAVPSTDISEHPVIVRFHIVTPGNITVRDLTAEALAKQAAAAAMLNSSRQTTEESSTLHQEEEKKSQLVMNVETGLYENMAHVSNGGLGISNNATHQQRHPTRLIGSMARFLAAESSKPLNTFITPSAPALSPDEVGMAPVASTIVRKVMPSYPVSDGHILDGADPSSSGSPLVVSHQQSTGSGGSFSGAGAVEVATRTKALTRLGDVLRAFVVPFASLTDEEISADAPLPARFGCRDLFASAAASTVVKATYSGASSVGPAAGVVPATSSRPRVLVFGVEPSLCVPIGALYSSMCAMDLALHITIDFTGCDNRYYVPTPLPSSSSFPLNTTTNSSTSSLVSLAQDSWQRLATNSFSSHAQSLYNVGGGGNSSSSNSKGGVGTGLVCGCGGASSPLTVSALLVSKESKCLLCFSGDDLPVNPVSDTKQPLQSSSSTSTNSPPICWNPYCLFSLSQGVVTIPAPITTSTTASTTNNRSSSMTAVSTTTPATSAIVPPRYLPFVDEDGAIIRRHPLFVCVLPAARQVWLSYQKSVLDAANEAVKAVEATRHSSSGGGVVNQILPPRRKHGDNVSPTLHPSTTVSTETSPAKGAPPAPRLDIAGGDGQQNHLPLPIPEEGEDNNTTLLVVAGEGGASTSLPRSPSSLARACAAASAAEEMEEATTRRE